MNDNKLADEELAQDILCEALKGIRANKILYSFYSWYWTLAKNRLNMFLRYKQNGAVSLEVVGGSIQTPTEIEQKLIDEEDINELNYAISRLSSVHRQIIIMYYLRQMKITQIAKELNLPEGTVKRRLFDAKNDIKKGISNNMNYGTQSYAPANLILWGSYGIPHYWNSISDVLTKQIFVSCWKEAKTIQDVSDEIGVAPVYFEEKLKYLLENKFIKETSKGRYLTDFCILPEQKYTDFLYELSIIYDNIGAEITEAISKVESEVRKLDFYGNDFPYDYLLWLLYIYACAGISNSMLEIYKNKWSGKVPDNNGKNYRISGRVMFPDEKIEYKKQKMVSWSNLHDHFQTSGYSHITYANLFQMEPFADRDKIISEQNIDLVMRLFDNPKLQLSVVDEEKAVYLINEGYLTKNNDGLFLTMPVMTHKCPKDIEDILRKNTEPYDLKKK